MKNFNTVEEAVIELERRKKIAYATIEKRGDIILSDNSFISRDMVNEGKYKTLLMIITKQMWEDIKNIEPFDYYTLS